MCGSDNHFGNMKCKECESIFG